MIAHHRGSQPLKIAFFRSKQFYQKRVWRFGHAAFRETCVLGIDWHCILEGSSVFESTMSIKFFAHFSVEQVSLLFDFCGFEQDEPVTHFLCGTCFGRCDKGGPHPLWVCSTVNLFAHGFSYSLHSWLSRYFFILFLDPPGLRTYLRVKPHRRVVGCAFRQHRRIHRFATSR
jgi:hypothetical protein